MNPLSRFVRPSRRQAVLAGVIVGAALLATVCYLALRDPPVIAQITCVPPNEASNCTDCRIDGAPSREVIDSLLRARTKTGISKDSLAFIAEFLDTSLRACGTEMTNLRLGAGESIGAQQLQFARVWSQNVAPQYRPPTTTLTDRELIEWRLSAVAEPWLWIDRSSLQVESITLDRAKSEMRARYDALQKTNDASSVFKLMPYLSPFQGAQITEDPASTKATKMVVRFALRDNKVEGMPIDLSAYIVEREGRPQIYALWVESLQPVPPMSLAF